MDYRIHIENYPDGQGWYFLVAIWYDNPARRAYQSFRLDGSPRRDVQIAYAHLQEKICDA